MLEMNHQNHHHYTSAGKFALVAGAIMLFTGVTSLIFPGPMEALPALMVNTSYGLFMNILPANIINKIALIIFGTTGLVAAKKPHAAKTWAKAVFFLQAPLAIMGMFPATDTMFGLAPLFGTQIATYGMFALLGAYFGFKRSA